ncbi:MAG TPA: hypothetical protein VGD74_01620 [Vulgatibacter sp.]
MAKKVTREKVPLETRALAAAKMLVEGKSSRQAAREAGTSKETARRAAMEAETDPDLRQLVAAHRARALPKWLKVLDKASDAALAALDGAEGRDVAAVVKAFSDLTHRAAGEADVKHEHTGDLAGARDALAARLAAVAGAGGSGGGAGGPVG